MDDLTTSVARVMVAAHEKYPEKFREAAPNKE